MQDNVATLEYDYSIAKLFLFSTLAFGFIGMLIGVVLAFQLAFPDLNYIAGEYGIFGRLRPLHTNGIIYPLIMGTVPFFSRQVEGALDEIDHGLIEAVLSMGSSPLEIIFRVYLRESIAAIARGTTITAISLVGLTAMAGAVGSGGLGNFAIQYGHDRNMTDVTWVTVIVVFILVSIIQLIGNWVVKKNKH